jgi:hypothetical protein
MAFLDHFEAHVKSFFDPVEKYFSLSASGLCPRAPLGRFSGHGFSPIAGP